MTNNKFPLNHVKLYYLPEIAVCPSFCLELSASDMENHNRISLKCASLTCYRKSNSRVLEIAAYMVFSRKDSCPNDRCTLLLWPGSIMTPTVSNLYLLGKGPLHLLWAGPRTACLKIAVNDTCVCVCVCVYICIYIYVYTGCNRRNGPDFGRVFLRSNYTYITQNTYIQSSMVTEILDREVWNIDSYYSLIDYQIHIETGRNMWFL